MRTRDRHAVDSLPARLARLRCTLLGVIVGVTFAIPTGAQQPAAVVAGPLDSSVVRWARANAIPLRSVDAPYLDSSFAFLRPLVGDAHVLALGELAHGGHQPLALRNEVIRYAVTHLGFTAVALESGLTEAMIVDRFIQGGPGNVDTVVRTGFTWEFETLPENRDLVVWLRTHNAHAATKVHFYGLDLTGANDTGMVPRASRAVVATLDYLQQVAPPLAAAFRARLLPLLDRFMPARYKEYSPADRDLIRSTLDSAYQTLVTDSSRYIRATSSLAYARGSRNAWMAVRLNALMVAGIPGTDSLMRAGLAYRDSMMAENTQWVRHQQPDAGRVLVYAHDGHVMDGNSNMLGHRLRAAFNTDLVIVASVAGTIIGGAGDEWGWIRGSVVARADPTSFAAPLAAVGLPTFIVDTRTSDRNADVATALARPWPFPGAGELISLVPRRAFDAIVYFDRVTPVVTR